MIPNQTRERQIIPLAFQDRAVRTVLIDGVPWFVAKDVCDILEIKNPTDALKDFPENERMTLDISEGHSRQRGGAQFLNTINEPGLYRLIFQSRKPEAEQFKTWVFSTVLPQIRQTGFFIPASPAPDERLLSLAITRYFASKRPNKQADLEIGKCLVLLKDIKPHGTFMPCLSELGIPHRSALRHMKNYRKFEKKELLKQQADIWQVIGSNPIFAGRQLSLFHFRNELPLNAI